MLFKKANISIFGSGLINIRTIGVWQAFELAALFLPVSCLLTSLRSADLGGILYRRVAGGDQCDSEYE